MQKSLDVRLSPKRLKSYKVLSNEGLISKDDRKANKGVSLYFKSSVSDDHIREVGNCFFGVNSNLKMTYTLGYVVVL